MAALKWSVLKSGDIVDVVAPGSGSQPENTQKALKYPSSLGLVPRLPEASFERTHPFHSNTDLERLNLLKKAFFSKDSSAVWCLRGGYGSLRLIPSLLKLKKPKKTKLMIGYSDITSLHLFVNQKWKWPSLHGPLLDGVRREDLDELQAVLFGRKKTVQEKLVPINDFASRMKKKKTSLTGGNLTVLAAQAGTPLSLRSKGKIVVLEDTGERGYRIDRMLEQLRQARSFEGAVAIVFGDFILGNEASGRDLTQVAIERFSLESKIPCFMGIRMGHGESNRPWFFNTEATVQGGTQPQLIVQSGVLELMPLSLSKS